MLRTKLGLEKTGIFGFWFEISCLTLPLISIWLPGSPFEPRYSLASPEPTLSACSEAPTAYALKVYNNSDASTVNGTYDATSDAPCVPTSVVTPSIVVFLIGVILSRIGKYLSLPFSGSIDCVGGHVCVAASNNELASMHTARLSHKLRFNPV